MYHEVASYPGTPDSATVGMSGIEPMRFGEVTAINRMRPAWTWLIMASIGLM